MNGDALLTGAPGVLTGALSELSSEPWPATLFVAVLVLAVLLATVAVVQAEILRSRLRSEQALLESEQRYRMLADTAADVIIQLDLAGIVRYVSPAVSAMFGREPASLVGQPSSEYIHPDDADQAAQDVRDLIITGAMGPQPIRFRHSDGHWVWIEPTGRVIRDDTGRVTGVQLSGRDVTARKAAETRLAEQERHTRLIIEHARDPFIGTDGAGRIVEWNRSAEELLGWPRGEVLGRRGIDLLVPGRLRGQVEQRRADVVSAGPGYSGEVAEMVLRSRTGREVPVEVTTWAVPGTQPAVVYSFVRDITTRLEIEQSLRQARERALEASRLKSEFLASVSHEIRTPLNGVIGLSELLLATPLDAGQQRYATGIAGAGKALLVVINDLLDFSKLEAGKFVIESTDFDLAALVDEVAQLLGGQAAEKGVALNVRYEQTVPTWVRGDPGRIRQVLLNLVGNAVKFTAEGEVVGGVAAAPTRTDAVQPLVRIEVSDTGIGIEEADRERIFDAFAQADPSNANNFGGTGLGLAVCRRLVVAMGGELGVDSVVGEGSTFWCELPLPQAPRPDDAHPADGPATAARTGVGVPAEMRAAAAPPSAGEPATNRRARLLLADDNDINQQVAVALLTRMGHTTEVVSDGTQALEALERGHYDAVLMDCQMPRLDGYQATIELRRREGGAAHVPVIALTAGAQEEDRERCLAAGMDDFITKPIDPVSLGATLSRWLPDLARPTGTRADSTGDGPGQPAEGPAEPEVAQVRAGIERRMDKIRGTDPDAAAPLVESLTRSLQQRVPGYLDRLTTAVKRGDTATVAAEAHSLTGAAANLGAERLAAVSADLVRAGRDGRLDAAPALLQRLRLERKLLDRAIGGPPVTPESDAESPKSGQPSAS